MKSLLVIVSLVFAVPCFAGLFYSDGFREYYSQILESQETFPMATPLEPTVRVTSEENFAAALLTRTDGAKVPYSEETAYIEVTGAEFRPLQIKAIYFRTITIRWATARILVINRNIGRIARIEEVIDVVDRKWLSQQSVHYSIDE